MSTPISGAGAVATSQQSAEKVKLCAVHCPVSHFVSQTPETVVGSSSSSPGILAHPGSSRTGTSKKLTFADPIAEMQEEDGWIVHEHGHSYKVDVAKEQVVDTMADSEIKVANKMMQLNKPVLMAVAEVNISGWAHDGCD